MPIPPFKQLFRWLAKALAVAAMLALVGLATLLALLSRDHNTPVTLPTPTGHFAVGRSSFAWVSNSQIDELSPLPETKRAVLVWMWYPASPAAAAPSAEYLQPAWRKAEAEHSGALMSKYLTRDLSLVHAHSTVDPAVSPEQRSYPIVILRAGGGALTTDFTTLAEDLASHGYIVVGFDAPHRTSFVVLPDGRVVTRPPANDPEDMPADQADRSINQLLPLWVSDTKFVVDQLDRLNVGGLSADDPSARFTGRLDLQHLGMFGHSFGGAQALQFCHDDARCKAGIDIDGAPYGSVIHDGLQQPFLLLLSDHSREPSNPASAQIRANLQSIYSRLPNGRLLIAVRGANHFTFSDQMLVKSSLVIALMQKVGFGNLEARRGLAITTDYVHTFFDVYLKGAPTSALTGLANKYPEVQLNPF